MIIDVYDDPAGTVLRKHIPEESGIPDFIKQAASAPDDSAYSDDSFALVMVDQGKKLRKFACVDKGNTALSAIYLMENADKLPEEAVKVAAINIADACEFHGLAIPVGIRKMAATPWNKELLKRMSKRIDAREKRLFSGGIGWGSPEKVGPILNKQIASPRAKIHRALERIKGKEKTSAIGTALKLGFTGMSANDGIAKAQAGHGKLMGGGQPKVADVVGTEMMPQSL